MTSLFNYAKSRFEARKAMEASLSDRVRSIYIHLLRLCILKCLRIDRLMQGYEHLVKQVLGE